MDCKIFYRISSESRKTPRLPGANKIRCLKNFVTIFGESNVAIFADNCKNDLIEQLKGLNLPIYETKLGNSGSFLNCLKQAIDSHNDEKIIYFVEDDYIHLPLSSQVIFEGIELADYVTLYDHPDKYTSFYDHGETTRVFRSKSTHWKQTISTCMTFASKIKTLRQDLEIWEKACSDETPHDHEAFVELRSKNKFVLSSIPGLACHTDLSFSLHQGDNQTEPWAINYLIDDLVKSIYQSWNGDAIELMEDIKHYQKKSGLELLTLLAEIEIILQKKEKSAKLILR